MKPEAIGPVSPGLGSCSIACNAGRHLKADCCFASPAGHDTNIYIINAKPPAVLARFQQYRMGDVGLCSVVAAELAFGVAKSGSARNRHALEMFLAPLTILPFDEAAVWAYGDLRADLKRRGTPIGALDTMIAAHALSQQALLVTNDTREFAKVTGLQLDNWATAA